MASKLNSLEPNETLEQSVRRILVLQLFLALIAAAILLAIGVLTKGWEVGVDQVKTPALGLLYGAAVGMMGTLLSKRSADRSSRAIVETPRYALLPVYIGLVNKLVIVGGGLAFGPIALGLGPIYVVSGYLVAMLAFVWVAVRRF